MSNKSNRTERKLAQDKRRKKRIEAEKALMRKAYDTPSLKDAVAAYIAENPTTEEKPTSKAYAARMVKREWARKQKRYILADTKKSLESADHTTFAKVSKRGNLCVRMTVDVK